MTLQEYTKHTQITSPQEAENLLKNFQILFVLSALTALFANIITFVLPGSLFILIFGILSVVVLVFFMLLSREIIRKTRMVSRAHWYFSFLFAPLSWIFFYPQITKPLKVLLGKKLVPEDSEMEQIMKINAGAKPPSRLVFVLIVVMLVLTALFSGLYSIWLYSI